jgi:hypothetical protein
MDIACAERVVVVESWAGRGARIAARDYGCCFNDVFRTVCTITVLALMELTLTHVVFLSAVGLISRDGK